MKQSEKGRIYSHFHKKQTTFSFSTGNTLNPNNFLGLSKLVYACSRPEPRPSSELKSLLRFSFWLSI